MPKVVLETDFDSHNWSQEQFWLPKLVPPGQNWSPWDQFWPQGRGGTNFHQPDKTSEALYVLTTQQC